MTSGPLLRTERLILRRWTDADRDPFAAINADPAVMEHFPPEAMSRSASDDLIVRIEIGFEEHGFGLWALERRGELIGFTGLVVQSFNAHFTPAVEVGWRLARSAWGRGYATEAGREALRFGFEEARLAEIVSMCVPANERSRRVMGRLGMIHDPADDFDHPRFPPGHRLRRHLLYRITSERWRARDDSLAAPAERPLPDRAPAPE